ncbi:MAG: patatin-like phospholipase family protein [Anaerolineaceae bacterium]|nr:patatin-like phospholipase family protein [Anaerolineaceae bacterium]
MSLFNLFKKKNNRIGLALSGGGLHGAAHVGVLQVLEREGIRPEIIAGTSAGALVGGAYAAGVTTEQLSEIFLKMSWTDFVRPAWRNSLGMFNTKPMEDYITRIIGEQLIEELPIKFLAVTCDILTGEKVLLNKGRLATAMRASSAYPGLFTPVETDDGKMLIDGGVIDNLPAELVRAMGADYVIGVDVSEHDFPIEKPTGTIEMLLAISTLMQTRSAYPGEDDMDCLIRPDLRQYSSWKTGYMEEMMAAGRASAELAVLKIKKDLK